MKKQHYLFFTILFSLFSTPSVFGQQCHDYACALFKVERLFPKGFLWKKQKQKDYSYGIPMEKALLDNLDSAVRRDSYGKGYPDSKAEQIRALRRRVFLAIAI